MCRACSGAGSPPYPRLVARPLALLAVIATLAACGGGDAEEEPALDAPPSIDVTSPAFGAGKAIPKEFGCDDAELSPPLEWTGVPNKAESLVLLMEDPDASRRRVRALVRLRHLSDPRGSSPRVSPRPAPAKARTRSATSAMAGGARPRATTRTGMSSLVYALRDAPDLAQRSEAGRGARGDRGRCDRSRPARRDVQAGIGSASWTRSTSSA